MVVWNCKPGGAPGFRYTGGNTVSVDRQHLHCINGSIVALAMAQTLASWTDCTKTSDNGHLHDLLLYDLLFLVLRARHLSGLGLPI